MTTKLYYSPFELGIRLFINIVTIISQYCNQMCCIKFYIQLFLLLESLTNLSSVSMSLNKLPYLLHLRVFFYFCGLSGEIYFPTNSDNPESAVMKLVRQYTRQPHKINSYMGLCVHNTYKHTLKINLQHEGVLFFCFTSLSKRYHLSKTAQHGIIKTFSFSLCSILLIDLLWFCFLSEVSSVRILVKRECLHIIHRSFRREVCSKQHKENKMDRVSF